VSHLALLDACVLVPQRLSSLLLTLAEHGGAWRGRARSSSELILDENAYFV